MSDLGSISETEESNTEQVFSNLMDSIKHYDTLILNGAESISRMGAASLKNHMKTPSKKK